MLSIKYFHVLRAVFLKNDIANLRLQPHATVNLKRKKFQFIPGQ